MPRLNTLIEIGFCSGYQDGDYRVSGQIEDLSRERFAELLATIQWASSCAIDMWRRGQEKNNPSALGTASAASAPPVDSHGAIK